VDNRILSLKLVELKLTPATMFSADGRVLQASDALHKKPVLMQRGSFRPPTHVDSDMHQLGLAQMSREEGIEPDTILSIAEMTMSSLTAPEEVEEGDALQRFLESVDILAPVGLTCVVTSFPEYYRIAEQLTHFTKAPVGMTMGADTLRAVFDDRYYEELGGGILEAMGRLFKRNVRLYVYPFQEPDTGQLVTAKSLDVHRTIRPLYQYLLDRRSIQDLEGYTPAFLSIRSPEVRKLIRSNGEWERLVQPEIAKQIRHKGLFGCTTE